MTNRLKKLADQLRELPNQEQLQRKYNTLKKIGDESKHYLEEVGNAKNQALALRAIESSVQLDATLRAQLGIVKARAETLLTLTTNDKAVTDNAKVSARLEDLRMAAQALRQSISKEWTNVSESEFEKAKAFLELASRYDDAAAQTLKAALQRFSKQIKFPPTSKEEIDIYRSARAELTAARDALHLEGAIGTFLLSCLKQEGDPRELERAELKQFLKSHPVLWQRLRVVLN